MTTQENKVREEREKWENDMKTKLQIAHEIHDFLLREYIELEILVRLYRLGGKNKDEANAEAKKFLSEKPLYRCRFHPTDWWHEVGCSHQVWTVEQLQGALDRAKRSNEWQLVLRNRELKSPSNKDN